MNLLLIEDDPLLGPLLTRRFTRRGYSVVLARSVADARRHVSTHGVDLIVTDRDVLDGDAWQYVYTSGIPAVYMSGRPPEFEEPDVYFAKGQDELAKLDGLIESCLAGRDLESHVRMLRTLHGKRAL